MRQFFEELQRRNVVRVAIAYLAVSWLLIQVVETLFPVFGLSSASIRLIAISLFIGFPFILIFSWLYELTPEGLKAEKDVDRSSSIVHHTGKNLDRAIIVVLALALGYFAVDKFVMSESREASIAESARLEGRSEALRESYGDNSIAVLPFVNMSDDQDIEYFSDGISEELLNLLAKIPQLRVISRSSAFSFKGKEIAIPEIARQLNVDHVLEGSVRKSGNRVRITAQLIDVRSDSHLWSETYDRTLDDIFVVQDEISAAVVDSLKISLLDELPVARAVNSEAHTLFLRGNSIAQIHTEEELRRGAELLREALNIEPEFADAWAALATVRMNQVGSYYLPRDEGFAQARAAIKRALEIDPGNATARSGLCWILMYHERDFPTASDCVEAALGATPRDASTLNTAATFYRNLNQFDLAIDAYKAAQEIDPLSSSIIFNLVIAYMDHGQLDRAAAQLEIGRSMFAAAPLTDVLASAIALRRDAPEEALAYAENIPGTYGGWARALAYSDLNRLADVDSELQQIELSRSQDAAYIVAAIHAYRGNADAAFEWLERAFEVGDDNLVEMGGKYFWSNLHDDPRWQPFLARIGISDSDINALGY